MHYGVEGNVLRPQRYADTPDRRRRGAAVTGETVVVLPRGGLRACTCFSNPTDEPVRILGVSTKARTGRPSRIRSRDTPGSRPAIRSGQFLRAAIPG